MRNKFIRAPRGALIAFALISSPIYTASAAQVSSVNLSDALDPGEFRWTPNAAREGAVEIVVSLPLQLAYVYRGGTLIGVSTVSSGAPGHETPAGSFTILQKNRDHRSNLYDDAPMPFMQRLTWDGVALHAGQIPGRPASHGCIRLPMAFARHLFEVTKLGAAVHVIEDAASPEEAIAYLSSPAVQVASTD
jgi:lipoprotein-anchoring transpeptidase ErfK/SrfK